MISLEKKSIKLSNGEVMAYLEQGAGDAVILLHGNMSSSVFFKPLLERLKGYRIVAPDMRGFGDSSYNAEFSSFKELAEDISLIANALNIKNAHIVAWSAGGGVALELAAANPNLVRSLFIISGASHTGFPLFKKKADFSSTTEPYLSKAELAGDPLAVAPCLAATATGNYSFFETIYNASIYLVNKPSKEDSILYAKEALKQRNLVDLDWAIVNFNMSKTHNGYCEGDDSVDKVKCPIIFTCADKDYLVPKTFVLANHQAFKGSKLIEYSNCGHSPFVDCPDKLIEDIKGFLSNN